MFAKFVSLNRVVMASGFILLSAGCSMFETPGPEDVEKSRALIETAVDDTETVANRARIYHEVKSRKNASIQVEEAEVILQKARDEQERLRNAYHAAMAVLSAIPDQNPKSVAASQEVNRLKAILAETDQRVAEIEETVANLQDLDIPPRP